MGWLESFKKDSQDKNSKIGQKFLISEIVNKLASKLEEAITRCCSYKLWEDRTFGLIPRLSGELDLIFLEPDRTSFYQEYLDLTKEEKELVLKEFKDSLRLILEDITIPSRQDPKKKFPAIRITLNGVTIEPEKRNKCLSPRGLLNIADSMLTEEEQKDYVGLQRLVLKFLIQARKDFYTSRVRDEWKDFLRRINANMSSIEKGDSHFFKGYISKEGSLLLIAKQPDSMLDFMSIGVWGKNRTEIQKTCLPTKYIKGLQQELYSFEYDRYKTTVDNVAKEDSWLVDFYYNLTHWEGISFYALCLRTRKEQSTPTLCQGVGSEGNLRINAKSLDDFFTNYLDLTNWTPLEEFKGVINQGEDHV